MIDHNIVEFKEDMDSTLLFCPDELKVKARELMSSYCIGDLVSLDGNGGIEHFNGKKRRYGTVMGFQPDGTIEIQVCKLVRRGHE